MLFVAVNRDLMDYDVNQLMIHVKVILVFLIKENALVDITVILNAFVTLVLQANCVKSVV